jgi:hypothetical protein
MFIAKKGKSTLQKSKGKSTKPVVKNTGAQPVLTIKKLYSKKDCFTIAS